MKIRWHSSSAASKVLTSLLLISGILPALAQQAQKRKIQPGDLYRIQSISDVQVSPEGKWIAYVLTSVDSTRDKRNSDIWMIQSDGKESVQLTNSPDGESSPRWSPDGKYLSFTSSRQGAKGSQVWLMDRRGGEGRQLTTVKGDLSEYKWSPDSKRLLLVIDDRADTSKTKTDKPMVLDRYHFKQDVEGYLLRKYSHLYVFDINSKKIDTLTRGNFNETNPSWSPDGRHIAFVSNRTSDPDRNENDDIWIIEASKGRKLRQLTNWQGYDFSPKWSPDGKSIAYLRSSGTSRFLMYDEAGLAVCSSDGGEPLLLTKSLDRPVSNHSWASDGKSISFVVTDDRQRYISQIEIATNQYSKIVGGDRVFYNAERTPANGFVSLMSDPGLPAEIYSIEKGVVTRLTHHHDALFANLELATVEGFTSTSKDGAKISNLLFRPAGQKTNLPTLFYIHGGPVGQDEYAFDLTRQVLAASGYAVVGVNYRGSNGRGLEFTRAIYADWGNKEVADIHGAADYLIAQGTSDAGKLGIVGWSYGGMLTDYCIATDNRFKAAVSGAGSANPLGLYGVDQYVVQFEEELGPPWKNLDRYLKLAYPFLKADQIKTPTLFMVGEKDFNVPAVGSEQMYQALRSQEIPTGLVIYPGQYHGISIPSYQKDRFERYIGWFDKYLKGLSSPNLRKELSK